MQSFSAFDPRFEAYKHMM